MGVTQQGPGAASLPRCGLLMQVHMYDSPSFQPASRKGYKEGTFTASAQNDSETPNSLVLSWMLPGVQLF